MLFKTDLCNYALAQSFSPFSAQDGWQVCCPSWIWVTSLCYILLNKFVALVGSGRWTCHPTHDEKGLKDWAIVCVIYSDKRHWPPQKIFKNIDQCNYLHTCMYAHAWVKDRVTRLGNFFSYRTIVYFGQFSYFKSCQNFWANFFPS
jgi:hypothetical protein